MCHGQCEQHGRDGGLCSPLTRRVSGFLQPWLLLLLAQKPAHGYELLEQLSHDADDPGADAGLLYRSLRQFEHEGLVRSSWDTEGGGPARRVYEISEEGLEFLHAWAVKIRRTRQRLDRFLAEYGARFAGSSE